MTNCAPETEVYATQTRTISRRLQRPGVPEAC